MAGEQRIQGTYLAIIYPGCSLDKLRGVLVGDSFGREECRSGLSSQVCHV